MTELSRLSQIFNNRLFRVPDYQRGYAWEDEQLKDPTEDLEDLDKIRRRRSQYRHYTGTIVVKQLEAEGKPIHQKVNLVNYDVFEIVDGQQRFTTLIILLNEIARLMSDYAPQDAQELRRRYVEIPNVISFLTMNDPSVHAFFTSVILHDGTGSPTQEAEERLLNAKRFLCAFLGTKRAQSPASFAQYLTDLVELITDALGFVWHEVRGEHEVSVIFETMNDRGRPITQFEKTKNLLFFLSSRYADDTQLHTLSAMINATWQYVLRILHTGGKETDEDQLLHYHWAIYPGASWFQDGQRERTFDIHRAIKENAKQSLFQVGPVAWLSDYLENLRSFAQVYRDIVAPDAPGSFAGLGQSQPRLVATAQSIGRIGREANLIPLLMAAIHQYRGAPAELEETFRLVETFSFRLLLQGRYASTGRSRAFDIAAEVTARSVPPAVLKDRIRTDLIEYYCDDNPFKVALQNPSFNFYDWYGIRYFLFEYETDRSQATKGALPIDWQKFAAMEKDKTIEHILPQGEATLSIPYWHQHFSEEAWKKNRHRLGNLCISEQGWNSSYGKRPFPQKCRASLAADPEARVYEKSKFQSERDLVAYADWTETQINEREAKLVEFAIKRWRS